MNQIEWEFNAPAKINLNLRLLGRRPDGYTEIETLMVPIDLSDRLVFSLRPALEETSLSCSDASLPIDTSNLVIRAASAFKSAYPRAKPVQIDLDKKIPHGAGLGGGSSDAATTLHALNLIHNQPLSTAQLLEIAAEIGSDVAFFLGRGPCVCRGRGELLEPATQPSLPLLLVKPPFPIPTPWAYARWHQMQTSGGSWSDPQDLGELTLRNDLEMPVLKKYLILRVAKKWLLLRPEVRGALMSGSGSTLFAILKEPQFGAVLASAFVDTFGPEWWMHCGQTLEET